MDNKDQIKRIRQMERRLVRASIAVRRLSNALDKYEAVTDDVATLDKYYDSKEWQKDFADDEAGLLPEGLKRGVLSEDGIWNLLANCSELHDRITQLNILKR
ncbi:MAG: DUF4298 domain-containing protein [Prevotella sp.]|nr:DUF4298 domain-containing protein [Prevotella sp.]